MLLKPLQKFIQVSDNSRKSMPICSQPTNQCQISSDLINKKQISPNFRHLIDFTSKKDNKIIVVASHDIPFGVVSLPTNNPLMFCNFVNQKTVSNVCEVSWLFQLRKKPLPVRRECLVSYLVNLSCLVKTLSSAYRSFGWCVREIIYTFECFSSKFAYSMELLIKFLFL